MPIRRSGLAFERNYTQIPNSWLRDARLSYRARGVLAMLMTHAEGWQISTEAIINGGLEGRDAIRGTIKELADLGYLTRETARSEGRFSGTDYAISEPHTEAPAPENPSTVDSPGPENPAPVFPAPVNHPLRTLSSKEDHIEEEHSVTADAVTGGEGESGQGELIPVEAATGSALMMAQTGTESVEAVIAKRAYDGTGGALTFMAIKGIAKWAVHTKGAHPGAVDNAIATLYRNGRAVTKQTVGQFLDGIITPTGRTNRPVESTTDTRVSQTLAMLSEVPSEEADPFQLRITE
ncbi:HTH DNA binding domain protein [Arthrobacter phage Wheelbite]|uniref:HTH DNA binding domain protein n=1 Tax=Arthrobacter phage Wheelbite TaxID=2015873 RepID=A0A222ZIS7_9CAUD|nr:HTH DNA binding protein [Arthrobacter phage Wheelbite]ASR84172.1 HTH DNA binding domain protein [Arthrobacter phage Wheelbite]